MTFHPQFALLTIALALNLLGTGCAKEKYVAKPIDPVQISTKLINKDIASADFKSYLIKQGYPANDLPFSSWGLSELTYCALYHHTKLDVAKAQLALANAQINTAKTRQNPIIGGDIARSNQKNGDIKPWALGLNVEIPIETTSKRELRVEQAQYLADAAKLDVADAAWQLRAQIAKNLLRYHQNNALTAILKNALATQTNIFTLLQKRFNLGALSNTDLSNAKLKLQQTQIALTTEQNKLAEIRASLAADVGLSVDKFSEVKLKPFNVDETLASQNQILNTVDTVKNLQSDALLNRIDIRRSLAAYAAAESKIKLEVAKQTPDIALTPGFAFEFGDSIWSLGFSSLLSLLNKNQTLIAEATHLREIEGAQFEALQAHIIATLSQNLAAYQSSNSNITSLNAQLGAQLQHTQKLQKQFEAGLIDRLDITQNQISTQAIEQQLLAEKFNLLQLNLAIEDVMQKPIFETNKFYE